MQMLLVQSLENVIVASGTRCWASFTMHPCCIASYKATRHSSTMTYSAQLPPIRLGDCAWRGFLARPDGAPVMTEFALLNHTIFWVV